MADNSTLVIVSSLSALAGAIITQIISAVNSYFTDKRKQALELGNQYRSKKVEIGESFYYVAGEKLTAIKKNIGYWKNWNNSRTEASLNFLSKETKRFNNYMEKLNADNWKFNLISLYFNISFTNDEVSKANDKAHRLYLTHLDLSNKLQHADEDQKEHLYQLYAVNIFDMCSHYEESHIRLEKDMKVIKDQLLNEFAWN